MIQRDLTIVNKLGLHARAAAKFVTTASSYQAAIQVTKGGRIVNGKSIMGVMMLAAGKGSVITLSADGPDAEAALDGLATLVADRFGEGE
ncbi:HPr family phosphocarrier protein [Plasticicumulans sp.]|uniref:HPr family phosphocarrier protein n=1 Tax=Plasticicumulans sp. TaxID=2307179 RepID=UPI000FA9D134|nr:HPr family phosphocarrier protein [Plasticicumulans sp.]MBS0602953.1 HPr family phosphocarrier protein [Pseudomonadota bacterium]RTK99224.1 MAG: HPr family phosphocarrier protein [Xanthomonadales bacterium]HMV37571.1 HPr family phosphocarrier protein [Plasticicumulans sp.]HMW28126.1 HPr family phosphocarrier protein [Plasticicumulans sp.]HMW40821.1 HPr family phosphocarrier protein [Plasticicumulans sp.]